MEAPATVRSLWRRRDLVLALATTAFKGRYRRLGLGVLWAVINPLIQGLLIAAVFRYLVHLDLGFPFALFVLAGVMPWNFFVTALGTGTTSITDSGDIVQRVAVPRMAIPTAALLTNLFHFAFAVVTLLVLCAALAVGRMGQVWMLPAAILLQVGLLGGLTLLLSPLQVRYRDIGPAVGAASLAWFWATPIAYPLFVLHDAPALQAIVRANPMTGVVSLYRAALLHLPLDGWALLASAGWTVALLGVGWVVFSRRERTVADFI